MDIQKIKELALANGFSLKEQASGNMDLHSYVYEFANAIEQAVKDQAATYESCSIKAHEIIINETKNELIDRYDIAKEDEYLLESLVYRGACVGKTHAVPEGFVLMPIEPTYELLCEVARAACNLNGSAERIYRALIKAAQEPAND